MTDSRSGSVSPPPAPVPAPAGAATVSPSLGPMNAWAGQKQTGTFRPPPPMSLNDSADRGASGAGSRRPPSEARRILEMIAGEVQAEHEALQQQQDANRALEGALRQEQAARREELRSVEVLEAHIGRLRKVIAERDALLRQQGELPAVTA